MSSDAPVSAGQLQSVTALLEAQIQRVNAASEERDQRLVNQLNALRSEVENLSRNLELLMRQIDSSFQSLYAAVQAMDGSVTRSIKQLETTTAAGSATLLVGVQKSEETAKTGLDKVSSGVAMVDVLQAISEAQQLGIMIDDVTADIDERRKSADLAVDEKRKAYDQAAKDVYDGLEAHLNRIGDHIVAFQDRLNEVLDGLGVSESAESVLQAEITGVQLAVTQHRARLVAEAVREIDDRELQRAVRFQNELNAFVADPSHAGVVTGADAPDGVGLSLPLVFVAPAAGSDTRTEPLIVFGLAERLDRLGEERASSSLPPDIRDRATTLGARLTEGGRSPMGADVVENIRSSLGQLLRQGMLTDADFQLLIQHLDAHPVAVLEV